MHIDAVATDIALLPQMRLAIFARGFNAKPTGRGVLVQELTPAIRRVRPDIDVHLFAGSDPGWAGVTFRPAKGAGLLSDAWQMTVGVGHSIGRIEPDVLWCGTHLLPKNLPRNVPCIVTLLDVVWRDFPGTMSHYHRRAAAYGERGLKDADCIICISGYTQERLAHYWPHLASRSRLVHLAPSSSLLESDAGPIDFALPVVANVGTIEPRKNLGILLDAMSQIPEATLVQHGSVGWNVEDVVSQARKMPNVQFLGYSDERAVASLYRSASVAAFPSLYEGFHLPPLEAMAFGCPVIASDIPVHREILGTAAIYVPPNDSHALANALRRVIANPAERSRLVTAGRKQASLYSWERSARTLCEILDETINR